jgi:hypothetical protein
MGITLDWSDSHAALHTNFRNTNQTWRNDFPPYPVSVVFESPDATTVTRLRVGQIRVRFLAKAEALSVLQIVKNGSGTHPASYSLGARFFFPGGKATGA